MLELRNITKVYESAGERVDALRGIDLSFRENEFVSVLGPSGCGKTTLLNIIGGLDKYTSGDLIINGRSTKDFKDRDWDTYRNHTIGFVFQSYNLIPHQSVLHNVEMALTLSGVGRSERRRRAKEALEKVGLGNQLRKKPAQMSGGQMQRVAIARAIVNDPDIILADEPTGALDTQTGIQVMDILREIAKDRLVIMVTHNPELADSYSTRIVRMLDGKVTGDTNPVTDEEKAVGKVEKSFGKKPSMSLKTAFSLSLKNLITKKNRTLLTSFAGSIGIIGIALIYAVSQGATMYINAVQEDTLSSYPLTIQQETVDMGTLITTFMGAAESVGRHDRDAVYQKSMMYEMFNAMTTMETHTNDLASFKKYIENGRADEENPLHDAISAIQYSYSVDLPVYTRGNDGQIVRSDAQELMMGIMSSMSGMDSSFMGSMQNMNSMSSNNAYTTWHELLPGDNGAAVHELTKKQNELVYGSWPARYDEIILFLDERNELTDLTLYALGLKTEDEIMGIMNAALTGTQIEYEKKFWTYEEICARDYRVILPGECWSYDESTGTYVDLRASEAGLNYLFDNAVTLHVVGIARPSEDSMAGGNGGAGYTRALTEYVINRAYDSAAAKAQTADSTVDVFTGLPFADDGRLTDSEKAAAFKARVNGMTLAQRAETYISLMSIPTPEAIEEMTAQAMEGFTRTDLENAVIEAAAQQSGMSGAMIEGYIRAMSDDDLYNMVMSGVRANVEAGYAQSVRARLSATPQISLAQKLNGEIYAMSDETLAGFYDRVLEFSPSTYEKNLIALGCADLDSPSQISLYASTFADKDIITSAIKQYNADKDELSRISYTDYVGLIMSSVTTIIDAITYVLIAFVAVSLVVSSIMIGVITLISVQERTKEIGILRALGASKRNVSSMFNAETVMIGFASGVIGVGVTYLLEIPINAILRQLSGINNLGAYLPPVTAAVLILISVLLTMTAGIIPSRSAAKKDPVVALRTE